MTKKRYQEKRHLLQKHMETEEKLTDQALALKTEAMVAFDHTTRLHDTIERRKTIDGKIERASQSFESLMQNDLKTFTASLMSFKQKISSDLKVLSDEFRKLQ